MTDKYHTPTGGPDSTYVPLVSHVPQVDLLKDMAAQKTVEQLMLECLQRSEKLLQQLVGHVRAKDAKAGAGTPPQAQQSKDSKRR